MLARHLNHRALRQHRPVVKAAAIGSSAMLQIDLELAQRGLADRISSIISSPRTRVIPDVPGEKTARYSARDPRSAERHMFCGVGEVADRPGHPCR